jgi:hypothetical protein
MKRLEYFAAMWECRVRGISKELGNHSTDFRDAPGARARKAVVNRNCPGQCLQSLLCIGRAAGIDFRSHWPQPRFSCALAWSLFWDRALPLLIGNSATDP